MVRNICPTASGAKDWNPSAFCPRTGLSTSRTKSLHGLGGLQANYIAGTPYVGADVRDERRPRRQPRRAHRLGSGAPQRGVGDQGGPAALVPARWPPPATSSSTEPWTAGSRRSTRAPASCCGSSRPARGIIGQPITYRGPDGHQYVAVLSGVGGWAGAIVSANLDPRDPTGRSASSMPMKDLPKRTRPGGRLYVFALPQ